MANILLLSNVSLTNDGVPLKVVYNKMYFSSLGSALTPSESVPCLCFPNIVPKLICKKIFSNSRKTCEVLILKGADVTAKEASRSTALHLAAKAGSLKTAKVLLHCFLPSTLEEGDLSQNTPLHIACRHNHVDVVQFLLDQGADVTARNDRNMTCLDIAIEWEFAEVAKTLVKHQRYNC